MEIYDNEHSGVYDNTYNVNFYKTTDCRGGKKKSDDGEINRKVDDLIDGIDKKVKQKSFHNKIYFLMDVVHDNITYDHKLKDFIHTKESKEGIFKGFYDYKNSAEEVFKNKKGTCMGFSNVLKNLCDGSGIRCKVLVYNNDKKNFHHQLNTVFDNEKKYYVDPTWGFIVDNLDELKAIYRGEKPNPRTNQNIVCNNYSDASFVKQTNLQTTQNITYGNSSDTAFMNKVFLILFCIFIILPIIGSVIISIFSK